MYSITHFISFIGSVIIVVTWGLCYRKLRPQYSEFSLPMLTSGLFAFIAVQSTTFVLFILIKFISSSWELLWKAFL